MLNRIFSVAPMMACTDRYYRMFARILSPHALLYTEMVTTGAVLHGDRQRLLGFDQEEHPVALQLGGSEPQALAQSARIAEDFAYDEVNLNVGCPSDRVQSGRFGACLMKEPKRVAEAVVAMREAVSIPVTVKTRLGVDEFDSFDYFSEFIDVVAQGGCEVFIIHARKAWLKGLSPRENRTIPPLRYDWVYQLKRLRPDLTVIINGGIHDLAAVDAHLAHVDGVMVGREAYANPYFCAEIEQRYFADPKTAVSRSEAILQYLPYVVQQLQRGVPLRRLTRHLVGMFPKIPGARQWRRYLSEHGGDNQEGVDVIKHALELVGR